MTATAEQTQHQAAAIASFLISHHMLMNCARARRGQDWGAPEKKTCMGETRPLNGTAPYPGGPIPQQAILRSVLAGMAKPVYLLDFTYLSQLRKDAHPTKYDGGVFGGDCTHWCVAGLPDTWNVLFYAALTGQI
jgi:hypothetical protein